MGTKIRKQDTEWLEVPADGKYLSKVRDFAEKYGKKHGFSRANINALRISVDEICSNIMLYAYEGREKGNIKIEIERKDGAVVTHIIDSGVEFDYSSVKAPDLAQYVEQRMKGGLGLHLVRRLNDEVLYKRVGNQNVFTILKNLEPQA